MANEHRYTGVKSLKAAAGYLSRELKDLAANPPSIVVKTKALWRLIQSGGLAALLSKIVSGRYSAGYENWILRYDTLEDRDRRCIRLKLEELPSKPLISILMPVYNTPEDYLRTAIESVLKQLYPHWELCIVDDASSAPHVRPLLEEYLLADSRIRVKWRAHRGHIAEASNTALSMAKGEYIALLDHDDQLSEHALCLAACEINQHPDCAVVYSDEDKITAAGRRFGPYFKPDWDPVLFLSQNFICHLGIYKTALVREVGGFRTGFEGAQDWDLALRVTERVEPRQIRHIPRILYHWRVAQGSSAGSVFNKPYALDNQSKAVSEHLKRTGAADARVEILEHLPGIKVRRCVPVGNPLVSLVLTPPAGLPVQVKPILEDVLAGTDYRNFELLLIDNGALDGNCVADLKGAEKTVKVRVVPSAGNSAPAAFKNLAAQHSHGQVLGFLSAAFKPIKPDWLYEMAAYALCRGIGAVGAKLLSRKRRVLHAGIVLGVGSFAGYSHAGERAGALGYFNQAVLPRCVSAVSSACMFLRREVFLEVKGFDPALSGLMADIDMCLRIRRLGLGIVWTPDVQLCQQMAEGGWSEALSQVESLDLTGEVADGGGSGALAGVKSPDLTGQMEKLREKWGELLTRDPYYNPNLNRLRADFSLAFPPRLAKNW